MSQQLSALNCVRSSSASTVRALRLALLAHIMAPYVENNLSTLADEAGILRNLTKHAIHNPQTFWSRMESLKNSPSTKYSYVSATCFAATRARLYCLHGPQSHPCR